MDLSNGEKQFIYEIKTIFTQNLENFQPSTINFIVQLEKRRSNGKL